MHKIKKIVDLSWEFTADTPIYPGDPEPSVTVATTLENEGYNLSTLVMGTQTGSHVDAPYHFSNEGATIDQMELDFFLGDAIVVRVTDKKAEEAITMEDIEPVSYTHLDVYKRQAFIRMNVACPFERLKDGLNRFKEGIYLYQNK